MYKYFKENRFSIQSSEIQGDSHQCIGFIKKNYNNFLQRLISFATFGFKFNQYIIYDNQNRMIAHVKAKTQMEIKNFIVTYYKDGDEMEILFDKLSNGRKETYGILKYEGNILNIYSDENRYTVIKDAKKDEMIASWKQVGDYAHVEGTNELFKENKLLFILILHAFANVYIRHRLASPFNPGSFGPPIV